MTQKAFRPATSWDEGRAGTDQLAWQLLSVYDTKSSPSQQQISIIRYTVDDSLNVVRIEFGRCLREVRS
jgi:hypothetical protein